MAFNLKRQFKHDCDKCRLIAQTPKLDVYRCMTSVLARVSDDPSDYTSFPLDMVDQISTNLPANQHVTRFMIEALHLDGWKPTKLSVQPQPTEVKFGL